MLKLERRVRLLLGIVRLPFAVVRLFGFRLDGQRVPSRDTESSILAALTTYLDGECGTDPR